MSRTGWIVGMTAAVLLPGAAVAGEASKQGTEASTQQDAQASSQSGTITKQKPGTYHAKNLRTITVIVKDVDPEKHRVTFEATVIPEATTSSGKPIKLDQLKQGDTVRAAFDPKTGEVVRVDVTPGK